MSSRKIQHKLNEIIFGTDTPAGQFFDIVLLICIVLSVLLVLLESVAEVASVHKTTFYYLEWVFSIFFLIEYILRIYCSPNRWKYILSFWGFIDLLAVMPIFIILFASGLQYLFSVRLLRLMRVFRILKLGQHFHAAQHLSRALTASSHKISVFILGVFTLVIILGSAMYVIEGGRNGFENIPLSIYWSIVTITTVGYGDIVPQTVLGKVIASFIMLLGYGIIAVPTGIITAELNREERRKAITEPVKCNKCKSVSQDTAANFCSHCGTALKQNVFQRNLFED